MTGTPALTDTVPQSRMSRMAGQWTRVAVSWLPFADAASAELPLSRLLRLALFQVSVGMATVLLNGTLNRVMIVELHTPAWLVSLLIAMPLLFAPLRALIGHKSDTHRSVLGWRRVPYIWFGTLMQWGGLAIMPFALLLMSEARTFYTGLGGGALAFLLTGAGLHVTQTAGLALATDLAREDKRPRAVALLYVMLLVGMMVSAFVIGGLLVPFSPTRLVQVIQGAAVVTLVLNVTALWKQEGRNPGRTAKDRETPEFSDVWREFVAEANTKRLLAAIGLGAAAFAMQDALLEPYGAELLGLAVGSTTMLTGSWALGAIAGFSISTRVLERGFDPLRLAGAGMVGGICAFILVLLAAPLHSALLLAVGAGSIGFGIGLFSVGTLIAAMSLAQRGDSGVALGAWGAVQATAAGSALAVGGVIRDTVSWASGAGGRAAGYATVYSLEIVMLIAALVVLGPLAGKRIGLTGELPGGQMVLPEFPT
ncbi:BCD family MFS transporter [Novosphingobium sp. AAP93]|uniref:BCD family MFS transporter n=1 Tax=Novosphingobium sp. AAP93 TaxID=1523427 RepID=UPI0009E82441